MTSQVREDFTGPTKYRTWSKENELWSCMWRTEVPGGFNLKDKKVFESCKAKYMIYLDHTKERDALGFMRHVLDRCDFFMGAKLSKFARDGEKVIVLIGKDATYRDAISRFAQICGFTFFKVKPAGEDTAHETHAQNTWGKYLTCLARAHIPRI